jgi:replicative DNA helicase
MLISPNVIGDCVEQINADFFYLPAHSTIFGILVEFWTDEKPLDLITLTQVMRDRKLLESVGGAAVLTHLLTVTPTAANASYYMEIVREKYVLRQMVITGTEQVRRAYDDQGDVPALLDDSESKLLAIRNTLTKSHAIKNIKDHVMEAIESIEMLYNNKGALAGLSTGLADLDSITTGLLPGLYIIAARPSMGKTALCMNIVEHVTTKLKKPVGVFSLEMSTAQLVQRSLCSLAGVSLRKIRAGFLGEQDFPKLTVAAGKIAASSLFIDDTPALPILELRAIARRWHREHGIVMLMVDYLQLLRSTSKRAQDNRQIEVAEISGGLKAISKELNIPVVVAAQLNRKPDDRATGKPRMSDLRESGAIEQDADFIGLLMRGEYYAEDDEAKAELEGEAELNIAKQRNGPVGEIKLTYLKEWTRFETRATTQQPP